MSGRRVCIGLTETAGVAAGLADGFADLGWNVSVVLNHRHVWQYDQPHQRYRPLTSLIASLSTVQRGPGRIAGRAASIPLRVLLFAVCVVRNDVFVFLSRTRFVTYWELGLLKLLRKQTVEILLGSDARPPYMDGNLMRPSWSKTEAACADLYAETTRSIELIERFATLVVSHPPYAQLQRRRAAHILAVGLPVRNHLTKTAPADPDLAGTDAHRVPVVLHSPSSPEVKGTDLVRAAIDTLRREGIEIDYRELHGVPNHVVIEALATADLVIDQCYSDTPLAMFATEAAVLGRPVIVGGYAWSEIRRLVPEQFIAPTIQCAPENLTQAIRDALSDRPTLTACGDDLARYVQRLEPSLVAARLVALLDGTAPPHWWFDPTDVRYQSGCGLSAERADALRRAVLGAS